MITDVMTQNVFFTVLVTHGKRWIKEMVLFLNILYGGMILMKESG